MPITRISDLAPVTVKNHIKWDAEVSTEKLRERLQRLAVMGAEVRALVDAGDLGPVEGTKVRKGVHVPSYQNVAALARLRHAYATTAAVLKSRG